jgi:hypothetical protein
MKALLSVATLTLLSCLPAHAQTWTSAYGAGSISGMGSLNSMGSMNNMGGLSHVTFADLPRSVSYYQNSSAHGSADFVPSTFVPYEQAVAQGHAALVSAPPQKAVAQAAAEYRSSKRAAAKLTLVQDANGRIIKESQ